ncbi:uncharacterized protein N7496_005163 [Penicillium cataractarum]|uniref:RRM domain-containing protein n=1 Tax=Penicillium cataractarum TaxID=2100454 RepID=A0A9W9VEE4_9EURO|nr:uncharacterized protein N7496_005163 [Penicillium cataractarum]KAJ5377754.1 hypothetical protein N7496_005163 [Penicillium cataractarum]
MTIQLVVPNAEAKCPRGDRLQEEPSAKNAQGLFPPEACIFVGNLSTKVPTETLAEDLKSVFTQYGACHVKIKQDKKKGLPGAFVQFERVEDASAALASDESTVLHDRLLRIERAKGRRTACLGLRSLQPVTAQDVLTALDGRGSLEVYTIEPQQTGYQTWTDVAKVTFAFVDDCRDAIKYFQKDDKYYLHLLDMDGSPLLKGPVQGPGNGAPHSKPYNGRFPPRAGNFQRNNHSRQHRNGNGNFNPRNPHRSSFPKIHHSQLSNENLPPHAGYVPNPTFTVHGVTFNSHELHPPLFNPHYAMHAPPDPNGFTGPPPYVYTGPGPLPITGPRPYMGPHTNPDPFGPPPMHPPYLPYGQPHYPPPPPPGPYYPPGFIPNHGPVNTPPGMNGPPNGYFGPVGPVGPVDHMGYVEPFPGHGGFGHSPPNINDQHFAPHKAPSPVKQMDIKLDGIPEEKVAEQPSENDTVGGVPLNPKTPEKAPRLIRVYHADDEEEEDIKAASKKTSAGSAVVVSVEEITDNDSAIEADSRSRSRSRTLSQSLRRSRSQSPSRSRSHSHSGSRSRSVSATGLRLGSTSDSAPPSDSEKSKKTVIWAKDTPMEDSRPPSPINSIASTNSSHTCASPTSKPVDSFAVTLTGLTVEQYARQHHLSPGVSEETLQEIIRDLVEERRVKAQEEEKEALLAKSDGCQPKTGTDTDDSQNGSVARNCSVKSV